MSSLEEKVEEKLTKQIEKLQQDENGEQLPLAKRLKKAAPILIILLLVMVLGIWLGNI